jgi:hypothetical protein
MYDSETRSFASGSSVSAAVAINNKEGELPREINKAHCEADELLKLVSVRGPECEYVAI